jgi:hypothetical protein
MVPENLIFMLANDELRIILSFLGPVESYNMTHTCRRLYKLCDNLQWRMSLLLGLTGVQRLAVQSYNRSGASLKLPTGLAFLQKYCSKRAFRRKHGYCRKHRVFHSLWRLTDKRVVYAIRWRKVKHYALACYQCRNEEYTVLLN